MILTPHIGGSTDEAQDDIGTVRRREAASTTATTARRSLGGEPAARWRCPRAPGTHRLVHIHHNVPGVLAAINGVLAEHGVNIERPAAEHPRRDRLRAHRHRRGPGRRRARRVARPGRDDPASRPVLTVIGVRVSVVTRSMGQRLTSFPFMADGRPARPRRASARRHAADHDRDGGLTRLSEDDDACAAPR